MMNDMLFREANRSTAAIMALLEDYIPDEETRALIRKKIGDILHQGMRWIEEKINGTHG